MYCRRCGTPNDENALRCGECGEALQSGDYELQKVEKIPNYLAQSIIVTVLCCMPLGIPAIVYAAQVNSKLDAGDFQGAWETSRKARMWCWWSFGVGLALIIPYLLVTVLFGISSASMSR
jgi:hypothetical protein